MTYYATYKLDGGTATQTNQTYSATAADTSAIWATNSAVLTLVNPTITTSGNTSSQDNSSFYGLNAGVLATAAAKITMTGGSISTTGAGANGAFATGTNSTVSLSNVTINCTANGGHGVMATNAGIMNLTNVNMVTYGANSGVVATDRGSGTINMTGGSAIANGQDSPAIYSTGAISASGATLRATGAEGAVIEGANSITLTDSTLTTTKQKWGVMIYQSMSGDAEGKQGVFTMTGGSLSYTPSSGPQFYVTNTTGIITLKGVSVTTGSGVLVKAAAGNWGSSGSNGGQVQFTADAQTLAGDMSADSINSIALTLKNASTLSGTLTRAGLTLDSSSVWTVTGNSALTTLTNPSGISGTSITNIKGNGYTVTYDQSLSANSYLGAKTYTLSGGGVLKPLSGGTVAGPSIDAAGVVNAASYVAGAAPNTWIAVFGSSFATGSASATATDNCLPTTLNGVSVTINGKSAYLNFVGPTQINLLSPADTTTGAVAVVVTNSNGSATQNVTLQSVLPALFTYSGSVIAWRPSDNMIFTGSESTGVKSGDVIAIWANGIGATVTAVSPGLVFSGSYPTVRTPVVTIGGVNAAVSYCGLVAAGLYQINLTVPPGVASGIQPVVVTIEGASSLSTATMKIGG